MNWFIAKLAFRVVCGEGKHIPQFNEQCRLVLADDELHAFYKARLLGEGDCIREGVKQMVEVNWQFIDVVEIHVLNYFIDGAEIYSVTTEVANANQYIQSVKKTAANLLETALQHSLQSTD